MQIPTGDMYALAHRLEGSFLGKCVKRFFAITGFDRCLVLAAQAFTALIPLLILVSAFAPAGHEDVIAKSIISKFRLTGDSADAVTQLFDIPSDAAGGVSTFSLLLLLFSGVSFARRLQGMYRAAFDEEKAGIRSGLFAGLGLLALLSEALVLYTIRAVTRRLPFSTVLMLPISVITGLILWTSIPYLLLNRQLHWRRLLAAGGLAAVATSAYSVATAIYMPGLVERKVADFGLFGITIAIIGWLLAVAGIIVGSAVIGAEFDRSRAGWALGLKARFRLEDPSLERPEPLTPDESTSLSKDDLALFARVALHWLIMAAAVWIATIIVPGIEVSGGFYTYLWVTLVFGLVNAVLGPLLHLITLPLTVLTMGAFALVVNAVLLMVTAALSKHLAMGGLLGALFGSLVISVVVTVLELVLRPITPKVETATNQKAS